MPEKILFVDDDPELLQSFKRQLRREYNIILATSGEMGLEMVNEEGPFAVVVADMHMPNMDGVQFLSRMEALHPQTVRVMLTGKADLQTAVDAINRGRIFRFLMKPCPKEEIVPVLGACIRQHQLQIAERELLTNTLMGSINLLVDILQLSSPVLFSQTVRAKQYLNHIVKEMNITNAWQFELALSLSHIGFIALPSDMDALVAGIDPAHGGEDFRFREYYSLGRKLLEHIPRLEHIAQMIELQRYSYTELQERPVDGPAKAIRLGAQIVRVCLDLDRRVSSGDHQKAAWEKMCQMAGLYNPALLAALSTYEPQFGKWDRVKVDVNFLRLGMILDQDVRLKDGSLLISQGHEVTMALMMRLHHLHREGKLQEPIYVLVGY